MQIFFGQVYIQQGAEFPFTCDFQRFISDEISSMTKPSEKFLAKYGDDFRIGFNISAKHEIDDNEIHGPSVFRRTKDIEYTLFLPFTSIMRQEDPRRASLAYLFQGIYQVFESLGIESLKIHEREAELIRSICSDSSMFESESAYLEGQARTGPGVGPPLWHADVDRSQLDCS